MHQFTAHVAEQIGWYVYALRDPRDLRIFYIGKGRGNRVFDHAQAADFIADDDLTALGPKLALIREIHDTGRDVECFIIRHGLASEEVAYAVEASVLDTLALLDPIEEDSQNPYFSLKNLVNGHHSATRGLASIATVAAIYEAPPAPPITMPSLLIKIPGLWTPSMSDDDLYNATRQWWKLGSRRKNAKYAFAVSHGVIRAVYAIDQAAWMSDEKSGRWSFEGKPSTDLASDYLNRSVRHLYKRGQANPIYYQNC